MAFTMFGRTIRKVGVIGSGNIGPDIALHFSQNLYTYGVPVVVVDIAPAALEAGSKKAEAKMAKAAEKGALKKDVADAIFKNMLFTSDYGKISDADFIIEAAFERKDVKHKIFDQVQAACPNDAIFASNSSHMEPEEIFQNMKDKSRCLVAHYFFPAERNVLIEIVPGKDTNPALTEFLMKFYEFIGKAPIKIKNRYGYAVNPVFEGLLVAAILTVEKGIATVKQADVIAAKALGMGVGPFTAMNLTGGNPITQHGLNEMNTKIMPWYKSPTLLDDQIKSGKPWDTAKRGETVEYGQDVYQKVADRMMGAYFGMVAEIVESGISNIGDMELAMRNGLAVTPTFTLMNQVGVKKSYELVESYAKENSGFNVAGILKKQASSGHPWKIPTVFREDRGDIAVVKIRRPEVLNSLTLEVFLEIGEIISGIKNDPKIKGMVLTGFGTKAFAAGADVETIAIRKTPADAIYLVTEISKALHTIENLEKPVVCAMNGLAFGGGNELAMSCHVRITKKGQKAFVGQPEPKLGIIPGVGGTQRLPRLIGLENAWPILRTGNPISSAQAKEMGLIYEEVEGDVVEAGIDLAHKIIAGKVKIKPINKDPLQVPSKLPDVDIGHLSKKIDSLLQKAILEGAKLSLYEGIKVEAKYFSECWNTEDMKIGIENFKKNGAKVNAPFVHK